MSANESFYSDEHTTEYRHPLAQKPDKPEEACGVFGIYAPEEDVAK